DEAKLCEVDIAEVVKHLRSVETRYFNFLTARIIPSSSELYSRLDTMILKALKPIGHYLAGRILLKGFVTKP
ncbi:MAG: hypothetical protein ACREQW_19275, partial [Candidatus Binatia bacterium]